MGVLFGLLALLVVGTFGGYSYDIYGGYNTKHFCLSLLLYMEYAIFYGFGVGAAAGYVIRKKLEHKKKTDKDSDADADETEEDKESEKEEELQLPTPLVVRLWATSSLWSSSVSSTAAAWG